MSFEEFKGITYHTRLRIRIPGSDVSLDKTELMTKGKLDHKKADIALRRVYERENYAEK